jgi:hypothetical protein
MRRSRFKKQLALIARLPTHHGQTSAAENPEQTESLFADKCSWQVGFTLNSERFAASQGQEQTSRPIQFLTSGNINLK